MTRQNGAAPKRLKSWKNAGGLYPKKGSAVNPCLPKEVLAAIAGRMTKVENRAKNSLTKSSSPNL
jgi:hypothetical protein